MTQSKVTRSKYDFSACKDAEKLRKVLNGASKEVVEYIASTFAELQLPSTGKRLTKKDLVDAIVRLYFPQVPAITETKYQPKKEEDGMKKTLMEVRVELEGCTVEMLRDIVRKDSTVKGVSRMRKAELVEVAVKVVSKLNPEVVEAVEAEVESEYLTDEELANAVEQPVEADAPTKTKEEKTMKATKLTVNEAVAALQTAETESEMHEILMQCKREDMVSALSGLTDGAKYVNVAQSSNETARRVITELQDWREEEAFRALSYEEKYAALFDADGAKVRMYVSVMNDSELTETASRLEAQIPVNVGEYLPYSMNLETKVKYMMKALSKAKAIERVSSPETADELRYSLERASDMSLAILVKKAGLGVEVRSSYYNTEAKEAIWRHYATEEHKSVYEPESYEEAYSDYAGDNASLEEDIPSEREVDAEEGGQFEFTDELYEAYFPNGLENTPESELVELYLYEIKALNRYLARKKAEVSEPEVAPAKDANKFVDIQVDPADEAAYELTSVYYEPVTPKVLPVLSCKLRKAIKSIKAASTRMAVYEELMMYKKSEIRELEEVITGVHADYPKSWSKEQIALYASHGIMHAREVAEYRARPYEERYAELLDARIGTSGHKLKMMSIEELEETAYRLTGTKYLACGEEYIRGRIEYKLREHAQLKQVEDVAEAGDVSELKAALNEASIGVLRALVEKAGLSVHVYGGQTPKKINQPARDALLEYLMRWAVSF